MELFIKLSVVGLVCLGSLGQASVDEAWSSLFDIWKRPQTQRNPIEQSRLLYYCAEFETDEEKRLSLYESGRVAAERAKRANPRSVAARFWWVANHGGIASVKRNLSALSMISELEEELLELNEQGPGFGFGGSHRILASLYAEAPGIISIGSHKKAEEQFLAAISQFGEFAPNRIIYARWLLERDRKEDARAQLEKLETASWDGWGAFALEVDRWKKGLASLKEQLEGEL